MVEEEEEEDREQQFEDKNDKDNRKVMIRTILSLGTSPNRNLTNTRVSYL